MCAFDWVDHGILFLKLSLIGIPDTIHRWAPISPFGLRGYCLGMNCLRLYSGIPRVSHLGSLLFFFLFFNDLPCTTSDCDILMYTGDVKLFYSFETVLQRNIDLFEI